MAEGGTFGEARRFTSRICRSLEGSIVAVAERRRLPALILFSAAYFALTCHHAYQKPLWHDELYTLYVSGVPTLGKLWEALAGGLEQIPPLFHVITRVSRWALGAGPLGLRIPSIVGYWVMCLCLYRFVSRKSGAWAGWIAMLFPFSTVAYEYAYEARPYGLVMAFAGLALVSWQEAGSRHRRWFRWLFSLCLAASVSCHYFAVTLVFPFALGEIVRTILRRKIDWMAWIALIVSLSPLLLFLPLIRAASQYSTVFYSKPGLFAGINQAYAFFLSRHGTASVLVAALVLFVISTVWPGGGVPHPTLNPPGLLSPDEVAVTLGFVTLPFVGALAGVMAGGFAPRYVLPSVLGFGIAIAYLFSRFGPGRRLRGGMVLVLLAGSVFVGGRLASPDPSAVSDWGTVLRTSNNEPLPVVFSSPFDFLPAAYYAPTTIASAYFYLVDLDAASRYGVFGDADRDLLKLRAIVPVQVEDFDEFIRHHKHFRVYGEKGWLLPKLVESGAQLTIRSGQGVRVIDVLLPGT